MSTRLAALTIILSLGCSTKPSAPALTDEPVYQNSREGFRFLVPEGWLLHAKADVPAGKADKERMLAHYQHTDASTSALFEVSLADLPASADLSQYETAPSFSVDKWKENAPMEPIEAGGKEAARMTFSGQLAGGKMIKEVAAFRRGERVYFFRAVYAPTDARARDSFRRAVDSLIWTK